MSMALRRPAYRTYTITQLCREFGATPRALRFYEEQGLLSPTRRDTARIYSHRDRARLQMIIAGRDVGLSLRDIRGILDAYDKDGEAAQSVLALQIFQRRVAALEAERRRADEALEALHAAAARLVAKHPQAIKVGR